jgi:hypothetical protein
MEPRVWVVLVCHVKPSSESGGVHSIDSIWTDPDAAGNVALRMEADDNVASAWVEAWSVQSPEVLVSHPEMLG